MPKNLEIVSVCVEPTKNNHKIILMQSPNSRAINLGYLKKTQGLVNFVPARLNLGALRQEDSYNSTIQTLSLPICQKIINKYAPDHISTVTLLREALSCDLSKALYYSGIVGHYGDSYIGATHNKKGSSIFTEYLYENVEGLRKDGLWIVADTICVGRNLEKTFESLLSKNSPDEIILISPYASREGINYIDNIITKFNVPVTYFAWGALFGVDETTKYDMPWGHPKTEVVDKRDMDTFISMYSKDLCVGGDFGNNYYSPQLSLELYKEQLNKHKVKPVIPSLDSILKKYKKEEFVTR